MNYPVLDAVLNVLQYVFLFALIILLVVFLVRNIGGFGRSSSSCSYHSRSRRKGRSSSAFSRPGRMKRR